jgi:hypothetical protein
VVVINADAKASHQAVVTVMEAARLAGLLQLTLPPSRGRRDPAGAALVSSRLVDDSPSGLAGRAVCTAGGLASHGLSAGLVSYGISLPVPVVIGNINVGGVGKTPRRWLLQDFARLGVPVG